MGLKGVIGCIAESEGPLNVWRAELFLAPGVSFFAAMLKIPRQG